MELKSKVNSYALRITLNFSAYGIGLTVCSIYACIISFNRYTVQNMMRKKSSSPLIITKQQARDIVLRHQLLNKAPILKKKKGTLKTIEHLGYIQIDTISVIDRSHHIVLYTRCIDYAHEHLHTLQAHDKKIFEYWAHAASFVPMSDFRYYLRKMKEEHIYENWMSQWSKKYPHVLRHVRQRIKKEGALAASDFKDVKNRKRGPWWDWKPAKAALEILFWKGELMIKERRNFQRVYDLTERVLPSHVDMRMPEHNEEEGFFVTRALNAMGIATVQDIDRYIHSRRKCKNAIERMKKSGSITEVRINELNKPYFMLTKDIQKASHQDRLEPVVYLLSPFDNAIILRDRVDALFDFQYALECYTPPQKRKYGYFCLPILWKNNLVGRIDPKVDRKNSMLQIKSIYLENLALINDAFFVSFIDCLRSFAVFHKCDEIHVSKVVPGKYRRDVIRYLAM